MSDDSKQDADATLGTFLQEYNFSKEEFEKSGLRWSDLREIRRCHLERTEELKSTGNLIAQRLQGVLGVHSLKVRVKDPDHLSAKIIRMRLENSELQITPDSYEDCVKDLIGVRALHLFKDDWADIHRFVTETWEAFEGPVAYVREGDEKEQFKSAGCRVELHQYGYRSIHYRFKSQPAKRILRVELQVRTLFDEAWSEIDHTLRYPRQSDDETLTAFLVIFNRLAGFGDEMGMYAKQLSSTLRDKGAQLREAERQHQAQGQELRKMLSELQIAKKDKAEIQKKLEAFERSSLNARQVRVDMGKLTSLSSMMTVGSPSNIVISNNPLISFERPSIVVNNDTTPFRSPNIFSADVANLSLLNPPAQLPPLTKATPTAETHQRTKTVKRFRRKRSVKRPAETHP